MQDDQRMNEELTGKCSAVLVALLRCDNIVGALNIFYSDELIHSVIKNPVSFEIMHKKLYEGQYATLSEFQSDFNLLCANIITYNGTDSKFAAFALELRDAFTILLTSISHPQFKENLETFKTHIRTLAVPTSFNFGMTWADINTLGERLNRITDPKVRHQINKRLISLAPRLSKSSSGTLDLCNLPVSVLQELKQHLVELDSSSLL